MRRKRVRKKNIIHHHYRKFKALRLKHKLIFTLIGTIGVILIWKGIWTLVDITPILRHPLFTIFCGVVLAVFSGALFKLL